jgi:quercetin dioxygenase-like cupin family protein
MEALDKKVVRIGDLQLNFLIDEPQGSKDLVVFEFLIPARARVPAAHFHESVDEGIYGLDGVVTTTVDGRVHEVRPGDAVFIPRGSVHLHENFHEEPARALVMLTPGLIGRRYFEEMAEVVNVPGRPDPQRVREVMLRHGLIPA